MTDEVFHPPGSPEALEQYRAIKAEIDAKLRKGRSAVLDNVGDWTPEPPPPPRPPGGDDEEPDDDSSPRDDAVLFDKVMIPRLFGKVIRQVPISLPDPCPISCLGRAGRLYFYLSPKGELIILADAEHGQAHIAGLWSPNINDLNAAFPQFNQQGKFQGFRANYARDAMMGACSLKPAFQAHERVRGRGCWRDEEGQLVQHLGNVVMVGAVEHKPGEIDGFVYPGRPPLRPAGKPSRKMAGEIYERMKRWNWARGDLDARLLLGQVSAGVLSAALEWRPMAFLCGGAGTGKSTLQRFVRALQPGRLLSTMDASEAALRGLLGQDALAVSFDEIEADATNDKAQQVMKLARTAASGDDAYRSSSSQEVKQFTLRGSFLFSAIIPPSMRQADAQRIAFLMLRELPAGARLDTLAPAHLRDLGDALVARITKAWPVWQKTLDTFVAGLEAVGHAQRGAMQFGTLLAAAHLVLEDGAPTALDVAFWCEQLRRDRLMEYENDAPTWLQALRQVLTAQPDVWRGDGSPTVAEIVRKYLDLPPDELEDKERASLRSKLERAGLALVKNRKTGRMFLAIPPRHQAIADIFAGSDFQKRGGEGAWFLPLRMAPEMSGPEDDAGVLLVQAVPRLSSQRCALFRLDGVVDIGGTLTPIFPRHVGEDLVADQAREPGEDG
jgi:predicted kinase